MTENATLTSTSVEDPGLDTPYQVTDEQVTSIQERSWASIPGLLSADDAAKLSDALLSADRRTMISGPDQPKADPDGILSHEGVAWRSDYVMEVATSRRLSSAICGLMKLPDAIFVQDISFFKPPGGRPVPYHQDYSYWPFDRRGNLSLWIALVDISEEMGALQYLAGSHLQGPLGLIEQRDIRDAYPQLRELDVVGGKPMKAGDAQAHWDLTCHASRPNKGATQRSAVAFRYHRSDVRYTGLTHPHFDGCGLEPGKTFLESGYFPHVTPEGRVED